MRLTRIVALDAGGGRLSRSPAAARVRRGVFRILGQIRLCTIATVSRSRRAHANTAYFAFSTDLELCFLSHPGSTHCRNLEGNRSVALTVFSSEQDWGGNDRGLQLFGSGFLAKGAHARRAERLYARRFRAYARWKRELERDDTANDYRFYRVRVDRLKLFDERAFGGAVFVSARVQRSSGV